MASKGNPWDGWHKRIMADTTKSKQVREEMCELAAAMRFNQYIPLVWKGRPFWPNPMQIAGVLATEREVCLGGESRAGKTMAAMIKALCSVTVEGYMATFFRETEWELLAPGGPARTMRLMVEGTDAEWNEELRTLFFPRYNSSIQFGYLAGKGDEKRYQGFPRQLFNFEELTKYKFRFDDTNGDIWNPYQFLPRSMEKSPGMPIEVQTYATTNPGGESEQFVMDYFMPPPPIGLRQDIPDSRSYMIYQPPRPQEHFGGRLYLHGVWRENHGVDQATYEQSEALADPITRRQQFGGEWGVVQEGGTFDVSKIRTVPWPPAQVIARGMGIDKAGTVGGAGPRSAVGVLSRLAPDMARRLWGDAFGSVQYVVEYVWFGRWSAREREDQIDRAALLTRNRWGNSFRIDHEQEPGSGGKQSAEITTQRLIGLGYAAHHHVMGLSKEIRAHPAAAAVDASMVAVVSDAGLPRHEKWNAEFLNELRGFPNAALKDMVDWFTLEFNILNLTQPALPPQAGAARAKYDPYAPGAGQRLLGGR